MACFSSVSLLGGHAPPSRPRSRPARSRLQAPKTPAQFLALAEADLARTQRVFWNPRPHWYDQRLSHAHPEKPLASLWSSLLLFEALDAVAIVDPTATNRAEVRAFVRGAERYYNPNLRPVGGDEKYPGITDPRAHTYFDDNGWWEMAFLDAYRVTHDARDLRDAERAFRLIAVSGWDPNGGGVWWETLHLHKTSESVRPGDLLRLRRSTASQATARTSRRRTSS